ncbi:MAG: zinc-binding dehydrogenase [Clostridia bacterium]|nr:zinc-binding dehydrogenase [Clostridia bacterium]
MKGWIVKEPFKLEKEEMIRKNASPEGLIKVKVTKSLLTLSDVLGFNGENAVKGVALGSFGTGIISETQPNLLGLESGRHVYISPYKPCAVCHNCQNDDFGKCSDMKIAGTDYDGFLRDFVDTEPGSLFPLPESVSDLEALFIDYVSLAVSIIDKLHIEKGDYVSVVGANFFGIILSQILIYYQAVPILCAQHKENFDIAKKSGVYYVLGENDNWQKEVLSITGGRMTKHVVYMSDSDIPIVKAFSLASYGARLVYTGISGKNSAFSFNQAIKKQLNIVCINSGYDNTETAINLIANDAIDISRFNIKSFPDEKAAEVLNEMNQALSEKGFATETMIEMK